MSGGYTHVTLVQLAIEEALHHRGDLLHPEARQALGMWKKFCIVGAVSPDYPYLDVLHGTSAQWADAMHKGQTAAMMRAFVADVRGTTDANIRKKCLAWLFGFASHVVVDGTIHPVVNLKVGPYEENKTEHRRCEMSEDVYAQRRLNLGPVECNRQISANILDSSDVEHPDQMDPDIARLWESALSAAYPQLGVPDVHAWHAAMRKMMQIAESGDALIPFARHVAANHGLVYPAAPEPTYIDSLQVPGNQAMDFETIFHRALNNVVAMWGWLALALQQQPSPLDGLASMSLDTGLDANGRMTYWS